MKALRLLHLVVCGIIFLPLLVVFTIWWLFVCIRAAKLIGIPARYGVKCWFNYLKQGIKMNQDFVANGL